MALPQSVLWWGLRVGLGLGLGLFLALVLVYHGSSG